MVNDAIFMQGYQQGAPSLVWVKIMFPIQHLVWQWYINNWPGGIFPGDFFMRVTKLKLVENQMNSMSTFFLAGKLSDK